MRTVEEEMRSRIEEGAADEGSLFFGITGMHEDFTAQTAHVDIGQGQALDEWGFGQQREMPLETERRVASHAARDAEGKRAHSNSGAKSHRVSLEHWGLGRASSVRWARG